MVTYKTLFIKFVFLFNLNTKAYSWKVSNFQPAYLRTTIKKLKLVHILFQTKTIFNEYLVILKLGNLD